MGACAARPLISLPAPPADPAALLALVRAREEQITTLRARFSAENQRGGETHQANGVLLVKKPDKFRLRMMLPFGLTVFDYVRWGAHTQLALPLEDRIVDGPSTDSGVTFSQRDLGQAFLRGPDAFPGTCVPSSDHAAVTVLCRDASPAPLRRIVINAADATIRTETSYEADTPHLIIRYDDYRPVDGRLLPYHIALEYPEQHLSLQVAVQRYEVNPPLADDLFAPVQPWGAP